MSARTHVQQAACVQALIHKTETLWHLLDCAEAACTGQDRLAEAGS